MARYETDSHMIDVDEVLKPVTDANPCGDDCSFSPAFKKLETNAQGKPRTMFDDPEKVPEWREPEWSELKDGALEVLATSKHLWPAVILTLALLKTGGIEGFRDGLAVIRGMLERYWNILHPRLDPSDKNDPSERLNILRSLVSITKPFRMDLSIKSLAVCQSPGMPPLTLGDVIGARERSNKSGGTSGAPNASVGPDLEQIQVAIAKEGAPKAQATLTLVEQSIQHCLAIESFLSSQVGEGASLDLKLIKDLLEVFKKTVQPGASLPASEVKLETPEGAGGESVTEVPQRGLSGTIQSGDDVLKAFNLICDYYSTHDRSSPVPLLIGRARKLVDKDFMSITSDLSPDALKALKSLFGLKDEK